ncbi:MAG: NFACT family protein [Eubacteriaceae bacterium]|nr:NFACT family protein [Eubacteriaceae bacterium]
MPYDGLATWAISKELSGLLTGSKIIKIHQPLPTEANILFSNRGQNMLAISIDPSNARAHLSSLKQDNPANAPGFCMSLRKRLLGGLVKKVSQVGFDRIIEIQVESLAEGGVLARYALMVEIMGRHSNLVLVDSQSGMIVDSMKRVPHEKSSVRPILPGLAYFAPPNPKLDPFSFGIKEAAMMMGFSGEQDCAKLLSSVFSGVSRQLGGELSLSWVDQDDFQEGAKIVQSYFASIEPSPGVYMQNGIAKDFSAVKYSIAGAEFVPSASANEAADDFYKEKTKNKVVSVRHSELIKKLNNAISREKRKLDIRKKEYEAALGFEEHNMRGNLLISNLGSFKKGDAYVDVEDYYGFFVPMGEIARIPVQPNLSPSQNAQRCFKLYNKAKTALAVLNGLIEDCENEIYFLSSQAYYLSQAANLAEAEELISDLEKHGLVKTKKQQKKQQKKQSLSPLPILHETSDGFTMLIGRNDRQNEQLALRDASKDDIWLHAKNLPGSHVLLKTIHGTASEQAITEAAEAAAHYSSARDDSQVAVDYTQAKNLRKPPASARGKVIYHVYKTAYVKPQKPQN